MMRYWRMIISEEDGSVTDNLYADTVIHLLGLVNV